MPELLESPIKLSKPSWMYYFGKNDPIEYIEKFIPWLVEEQERLIKYNPPPYSFAFAKANSELEEKFSRKVFLQLQIELQKIYDYPVAVFENKFSNGKIGFSINLLKEIPNEKFPPYAYL